MENLRTLSELRKGVGLTQKEFAEILKVSDKTLWNYERDSSNIPNSLLSKVLRLFDIGYDEIFLGTKYDLIVLRRKRFLERLSKEGIG